jgi:hypothetical protein
MRWVALAGLAVWLLVRLARPGDGPSDSPSGRDDEFDMFAGVSALHHARYLLARDRFLDAHALTYQYASLGDELVPQLFTARDDAMTALGELRMRLPNDLDLELAFVGKQNAVDERMAHRIDDARKRLNVHVHAGPKFDTGPRAMDDYVR